MLFLWKSIEVWGFFLNNCASFKVSSPCCHYFRVQTKDVTFRLTLWTGMSDITMLPSFSLTVIASHHCVRCCWCKEKENNEILTELGFHLFHHQLLSPLLTKYLFPAQSCLCSSALALLLLSVLFIELLSCFNPPPTHILPLSSFPLFFGSLLFIFIADFLIKFSLSRFSLLNTPFYISLLDPYIPFFAVISSVIFSL